VRYAYKVSKKYSVSRTASEIEARSREPKMTLYSCDLRGEKAGRYVIEATPVGTIVWIDGKPKLKPTKIE
jgi:sortase (surface protein transpeptidase)